MKRLDIRPYPKMCIPDDASIDYLSGVVDALRFIMTVDLRVVSLTAAEALDRVEGMQDAIIESMEVDE